MATKAYLTPEEVADRLKVKAKTVREWCRLKKLMAYKAGDLWRISEADLSRFLKRDEPEEAS
jgi:excisionase family DNA binding protein